jgi:hypothetical protein
MRNHGAGGRVCPAVARVLVSSPDRVPKFPLTVKAPLDNVKD